ncbi:luciferase family oxidoreductase group 1 [Geomicrobium halophilum]|uniref:Luciferase family oxidoreductase group 1 n=1 Tax=Geomicrobium halophilum TaxID=549000 RepID=A0A841PTE3_9BACL|nr:LLM class flavin-dependent oxidoreductase [Geomicrobium halophilum]MBB6450446.1 luciferase family oxidoreductase group 1 [Geomicrobium halophilum]
MNGKSLLSVLDLAPVRQDQTPRDAFENSKQLVQHTEKLGYHRYWVAEHHNMQRIASSATAVLIGYLAGHSEKIRVGAGGVMLPNHAPLIIAEQFGTLETMYPDRIDLGLGRAPGTDPVTTRALRRDQMSSVNEFPDNVKELMHYFSKEDSRVKAVPGHGLEVPVYLLGSSTYSAQLAAALGLPFSFASHFAPGELFHALRVYRERFQPSEYLSEPYAMVTVNGAVADTTEEAERLATTIKLKFLGMVRGGRAEIDTAPVDNIDEYWTEFEKHQVLNMLKYSFVGDQTKVKKELEEFYAEAKFDELIVTSDIHDQEKRKYSYELLANLWN